MPVDYSWGAVPRVVGAAKTGGIPDSWAVAQARLPDSLVARSVAFLGATAGRTG